MSRVRRAVVAIAATLALWSMPATGAMAQDRDTRQLFDRLDRLQRELSTLQRYVYRGGGAKPGARAPAPMPGNSTDARVAARLEVRLTQLEGQIRNMTGKAEELGHAVRMATKRLDKLVTDVDFRLSALERKVGQVSGNQGGEGPKSFASSQKPDARARVSPPAGTVSRSRGTLGTLPRTAIRKGSGDVKTAAAVAKDAPATPSTRQQYDRAIALLRSQKFSGAERAFRGFIEKTPPEHALQANAHYWLAETYYFRRDYQRAAYTFADGFQKYPDGGKAPDSLLKLGMSLGKLGQKQKACTAFSRLLANFPKASKSIKRRVVREQRKNDCG